MDNEPQEEDLPSKKSGDNIRLDNFRVLLKYIEKQGIKPEKFLHTSKSNLKKIENGKLKASFFLVYKMQRNFSNISYRLIRKGKEELPADENYGFERKTEKCRYLDSFLKKNKDGLTLSRALSISDAKWERIESGYSIPGKRLCKRIAAYFFLPSEMMLDDAIALPPIEKLQIDEDLASIQRNDLEEQMNYVKNKHYLSRNFQVLSHSNRVRLFVSLLAILLPLAAFTAYSAYTVVEDRISSLKKMSEKDIVDSTSKQFISGSAQNSDDVNWSGYLNKNDSGFVSVKVGLQTIKVYDIKPANEYFSLNLKIWFDFSQDEFHEMYKNYANPSWVDENGDKTQDYFTVDRTSNAVTFASDGVPDYIELATPYSLYDEIKNISTTTAKDAAIASSGKALVPELWKKERNSYPGLTPSTIYPEYDPNFKVGSSIDSSTILYNYDPGEPYYLSKNADGTGEKEYRMFQCVSLSAKVGKAYDNPRYPLETAQFWFNITSSDWLNVDNLRYVYAETVDVSRKQVSGTSSYSYCSIDEPVYNTNGDSIGFSDGFRSIHENDTYKSHAEGVEYDVNKTYPGQSHSKLTVVIRANRSAFSDGNFLPSTFLQSYINLAAVIIWITIAFYNQSYAGEDSLGMLGTGMFSTISATIVGFQMLSDASMFSLVTMINIFTLAVILIMTYQSVMAKRAQAKKDKAPHRL